MWQFNISNGLLATILYCCTVTLAISQQTACTQTLRTARGVFDDGRIQELEPLLTGCIEVGFSKEERTEAYRLLILAYIYLDEPGKANDTVLALLKDNHSYQVNPLADPEELISLYRSFRTEPIFYFGARFGLNFTYVNVVHAYGIHDLNTSLAEYKVRPGVYGGVFIEKSLSNEINVRAELQYEINIFDFENSYFQHQTNNTLIVQQLAREEQSSIVLGLMGQYSLFKSHGEKPNHKWTKFNPYVGLGMSIKYIRSSSLDFDIINSEGVSPDGPAEDLIDLGVRKRLNPTIDLEIGIKKPIQLTYLNVGLRYSLGLLDITDRHYDQGRLSTYYGWAANAISLSTASFFIGVNIPMYSPKKLNHE